MKFGFLVTSAINTRLGVFKADERMTQTIATITSIRERCANAHITLIEMAGLPLQPAQKEILLQQANLLVDFSNNPAVKEIHQNTNYDVVKSASEMMCFQSFLKLAQTHPDFKDIDRFVKVSGRYTLNDEFNILDYADLQDKIVFARRKNSQYSPSTTGGVVQQYMSRCWSFPAAQLQNMEKQFKAMRQYMSKIVAAGGFIDIEHLLFVYTNLALVHEVDTVGVQGNLGPNGVLVKD